MTSFSSLPTEKEKGEWSFRSISEWRKVRKWYLFAAKKDVPRGKWDLLQSGFSFFTWTYSSTVGYSFLPGIPFHFQ